MAAPIRVGILNDVVESATDEPTEGGGTEAYLRLAVDDLLARRAPRPRRRVRACHPARAARGHRVRGRAGVRRARRAGRAVDRRPRDRRQRARGDSLCRPRRSADHQLGRHRAWPQRVHVPPAGGVARRRRRRVGAPHRRSGSPAGRGGVRSFTHRASLRLVLRVGVRRARGRAGGAGADRPVGHRRHARSGDGSRLRAPDGSCTSAWV